MASAPRVLVHVWAPPQEGKQANERLCTEHPGDDDVVVYHVRPVPLSGGRWTCLACGETSEEGADGTA